jgi:hypothetical protein
MCALRQTLLCSDLEFLFSICDVFQHKLWPIYSLLVTALIAAFRHSTRHLIGLECTFPLESKKFEKL